MIRWTGVVLKLSLYVEFQHVENAVLTNRHSRTWSVFRVLFCYYLQSKIMGGDFHIMFVRLRQNNVVCYIVRSVVGRSSWGKMATIDVGDHGVELSKLFAFLQSLCFKSIKQFSFVVGQCWLFGYEHFFNIFLFVHTDLQLEGEYMTAF